MHIVSKRRSDVYRASLLFSCAISSLTERKDDQRISLSPSFISVCQLVNIVLIVRAHQRCQHAITPPSRNERFEAIEHRKITRRKSIIDRRTHVKTSFFPLADANELSFISPTHQSDGNVFESVLSNTLANCWWCCCSCLFSHSDASSSSYGYTPNGNAEGTRDISISRSSLLGEDDIYRREMPESIVSRLGSVITLDHGCVRWKNRSFFSSSRPRPNHLPANWSSTRLLL